MYLARQRQIESFHYSIRKSLYDQDKGQYYFQTVFDLGENPAQFIHPFDDRIFFFDEDLEDAVTKAGESDATILLEELLAPFLPRNERSYVFRRQPQRKIRSLAEEEKREIEAHVHLFDRRRLYYIRYGAVDQSRIFRLDDRLYRPLLFKCRDEKEFYLSEQERVLRPLELKSYIFAIFNLQQFFSQSYSSFMPEALDQESVENRLVEEICSLNSDGGFWQDGQQYRFLHPHLQRYIIPFFDLEYENKSFAAEYIRNFRNAHRSFRWPERKGVMSDDELSTLFGEKIDILSKMDRHALARLFRKKAKECHPDSGGDHDKFVALLEGYDVLKKKLQN